MSDGTAELLEGSGSLAQESVFDPKVQSVLKPIAAAHNNQVRARMNFPSDDPEGEAKALAIEKQLRENELGALHEANQALGDELREQAQEATAKRQASEIDSGWSTKLAKIFTNLFS